jgi:Ni/Fe-hydrogenase subunit HybB-like protein
MIILVVTRVTWFFLLEMVIGLLVPITLLSIAKFRENVYGLCIAAVCTVLGFVANRLNVSVTSLERATEARYVPRWTEFSVTAMVIAIGVAAFVLAAKYLPVFGSGHAEAEERPIEKPVGAAVMRHSAA